jgi:1-acyl-sn-glycerol-3-phosphate acyltransferase
VGGTFSVAHQRGQVDALKRRLVTVPAYLLATCVVTVALPILLPIAFAASFWAPARGAWRTVTFIVVYLWCETAGILVSGWLWLRHRFPRGPDFPAEYLAANFALQCWWGATLKHAAERVFDLSFEVEGTDALNGPAAIMLPRHASMADTIIPIVFYALPHAVRLRYVLKRELLIDPCLDIVGNRLPNYFVDRDSADSQREIEGVTQLVRSLGEREGVLIYPEGTRFSAERRERIVERLRRTAPTADVARLERWRDILPPRLGGTLGILAANPGRDLVFCAHSGFEGSSHFSSLINGAWAHARIRIAFWRVRFADIPRSSEMRKIFVFDQWDRVQETVERLRREA